MKKTLKIVGVPAGLLLLCAAGALAYVTMFLPNIPVPADLRVEITPARVARGRYLAHHVAACMDCHSERDWTLYSGPLKPGSLGKGGERFDQSLGFPGSFVAPNITPHGLGAWTDGELYRAITSGVSRDGRPLFPVMPYPSYGRLATEDILSIIAYLRGLEPVESTPEASKADPPMNVILHLIPKPAQPQAAPDRADTRAYGAYLADAAGCAHCHTRMKDGKPAGEPFAGGFEFPLAGGVARSANITPHPATGIGAWTRDMFVGRFKAHAGPETGPARVDVASGEMQTVMPWTLYAGMTGEDLGAIFDFLQTLPPVDQRIERWTPAARLESE